MELSQYEQMTPHINAYGLTWITPNEHVAWRVNSLMDKEKDTIEWINTMQPGDVLYDVGANIGQYSMLAAKRGVRVHAFEPESQNFALLCRNIAVNKLSDLITPWPLAFTDRKGLDLFHVQQLIPGNSCNSFGKELDYHLKPKLYTHQQGCFGMTQGQFSEEMKSWPTHIKIDVDGLEHKVIDGVNLLDKRLKSALVETNTHLSEHQKIEAQMARFGFLPDKETAEEARRKEGPFTGIGNVIYYRKTTKEADFLGKTCYKGNDEACESCQ